MTTIRRVRLDDVDRYRGVRLRALVDAPSAFATTLEEALRFPEETWVRRVRDAATGTDSTLYLALDSADDPIGMVAAIRNALAPSTADLISMWVAPEARRSGTGEGLVRRVIAWASGSGYQSIELWVTKGNEQAERLYRRLGFTETGEVQALPSDPCKDELRMRLELVSRIS